jgi:hypothetical protein
MVRQGFKSLYYNSGSFGFSPGIETKVIGWLGPPDPTIRSEVLQFTRQMAEPHVESLLAGLIRIWQDELKCEVWVMPASHWAYELDFGSREWMPQALNRIGIDSAELAHLTNAAAIAFEQNETNDFDSFLHQLLDNLTGSSDFQLAWPGRPVLCTVHHHKQLWWTTSDRELFRTIETVMK